MRDLAAGKDHSGRSYGIRRTSAGDGSKGKIRRSAVWRRQKLWKTRSVPQSRGALDWRPQRNYALDSFRSRELLDLCPLVLSIVAT